MRRAAKIDANHTEVAAALRKIGCSVVSLASVGAGVPDLMVGFRGLNWLLEVKDGKKSPSRRALTDAESEFFNTWRGQCAVVQSADQALAIVAQRTETPTDIIRELTA